jgi:hypothetical protein
MTDQETLNKAADEYHQARAACENSQDRSLFAIWGEAAERLLSVAYRFGQKRVKQGAEERETA